jgi:hypothetical protein
MQVAVRLQLRRDTAANWTSANTVLAAGEIGFETDTGKFKIGDGTTNWATNSYIIRPLADYVLTSSKAQANGVASLDSSGDVPDTQISPSIARLDGPTFTGTVTLPNTTSIGDVSSAEIAYLNGVTSAIQTQFSNLDTNKADKNGPTFTGTVVLPSTTSIGDVSSTEIGYINGVTSGIQSQLDAKASTTDLSNHASDTTGIHGITDTADLATKTYADTAVSTHSSDTTNVHGIGDTADLATKAYADSSSSTAVSNHSSDTTSIHGIADTSVLLTTAGGTLTNFLTLHADPTSALHAVTKQYVDSVAQGLHIHEAAHAATTANLSGTYDNGTSGVGATLTLGSALTTLDGHTLNTNDRILVKNQTTASQNGVYVYTSSTVLTRATDFDSAAEIAGGDFIFVENGTLYNSTGWVVENEVNTVGTDDVLWTQFSGAGTYVAGTGITLTGNSFAADTTVVAPLANPTFTGTVTVSASGVAFTDGTQTKEGVPSRTYIYGAANSNAISADTTLSTLAYRDSLIEVNSSSAVTLTVPPNSTTAYPIGTSFDLVRMGSGAVTIAAGSGVTVNATPGLKLRAQYSSATLFKRGTDSWLLIGDLTA